MYHITFPPQSNRASWAFLVAITDLDNNPIDLSGCSMVFAINDKWGTTRLVASTENGNLTFPDVGYFSWFFTAEEMYSLAPEQHDTGLTLTNDDGTQTLQLSIGPLTIVDGVVP